MIEAQHSVAPHELLASDQYWAFGDTVEAPELSRWQDLRASAAAFWVNAKPVRESFREAYFNGDDLHVRQLPAAEPLPELGPARPGILQLLVDHRQQFLDTKAGRRAMAEAAASSQEPAVFDRRFRAMAEDPLYLGPEAHLFVEAAGIAISRTVLYARHTRGRTTRYLAMHGDALRSAVDPGARPLPSLPVLMGEETVRRVVVVSEPRSGVISQNQIGAAKLLTPNAAPKGRRRRILSEAAGTLWRPLPGGAGA
jgi:hypothetical protein